MSLSEIRAESFHTGIRFAFDIVYNIVRLSYFVVCDLPHLIRMGEEPCVKPDGDFPSIDLPTVRT
jgi:hypothetical protein